MAGWLTPLSLIAIITVAMTGLFLRRPWGWLLSSLLFGATAAWLLTPLIASPVASLGLWFSLNIIACVAIALRRPRGPALDWPGEWRRLLVLYSNDPGVEARPFRFRTDRAGPLTALIGGASFFVIVITGVTLYNTLRYPGLDLPISLVPFGTDLWGRLTFLSVYGLMSVLAVIFTLRSKPTMATLGISPGQGWTRALWTGFRVFMALYVVLLGSRFMMRTVEVVERRLQSPVEVVTPEDTATSTTTGQMRSAVDSALDRTRRPGSLSLQHLWLIIVALFVGPICEEIFFRGLIFGALRRSWPFWASALLSSAVFAASHGWGSHWGLAGPVFWTQIAAGGLAAAYSYELTGTLAAPIVLHSLWNAANTANQYV